MRSNNVFTATVAGSTNPTLQIPTNQVLCASAMLVATGTETGTLKFQASNDPVTPISQGGVQPNAITNWVDIASQTVAVGGSGVYLIPKFETCYSYIRAVYTHSGGAGNVTIYISSMAL